MFGECHAHVIMDGRNYRHAVDLHKHKVQDSVIREHFLAYEKRGITFVRDGGDALGVSLRAKQLAPQYHIDYRTPSFAIHKNGYYGGIVGHGFTDMKEYHQLVKRAAADGCDFIKIMVSGIMDFAQAGKLSCPALPEKDIKEMIHIAHEEGFAVMAHANGNAAVSAAARHGVDSVEHGNFLDVETLEIMAEQKTIYVPTISTIANLRGCGRFPEEEVEKILAQAVESIKTARRLQIPTALGSDAGAYLVFHGKGICDELALFREIFAGMEAPDSWLSEGEALIREKFQRK